MKERILNVMFNRSGGNASKNSYSPKISLPKVWLDEMGVSLENRSVKLEFNGTDIKITKCK